MKVLVLGGTHFVGRAIVDRLLTDGDEVATLTSGASGPPPPGVEGLQADRRNPTAVRDALARGSWDAVIDTWSREPACVATAVDILSGRVGHATFVSSLSVYAAPLPLGGDESAALVEGDPDSTDGDPYPAAKRGGELAAGRYDCPVLIPRPGLIVGPHENVGRLPFWLTLIAGGGRIPVPGPQDRAIQLLDARDLAHFIRRGAASGLRGPFNVASPPGRVTFGEVMAACVEATGSSAELVWVSPEDVERAGVEPWGQLPLWLPPNHEAEGLLASDVSAAVAAGLTCRPLIDTVRDTWEWLQREGLPADGGRGRMGYDEAARERLLARHPLSARPASQ